MATCVNTKNQADANKTLALKKPKSLSFKILFAKKYVKRTPKLPTNPVANRLAKMLCALKNLNDKTFNQKYNGGFSKKGSKFNMGVKYSFVRYIYLLILTYLVSSISIKGYIPMFEKIKRMQPKISNNI